jgi:hypothetical protein
MPAHSITAFGAGAGAGAGVGGGSGTGTGLAIVRAGLASTTAENMRVRNFTVAPLQGRGPVVHGRGARTVRPP